MGKSYTKCINCKIGRARYGSKKFKERTHCSKCRDKETMANLDEPICKFNNCVEVAYYNYKNEQLRKYCSWHKFENMVNLQSYKECECGNPASFGDTNYVKRNIRDLGNKSHCFKCKTDEMGQTSFHMLCIGANCNNEAIYGNLIDRYPLYCEDCIKTRNKNNNLYDLGYKNQYCYKLGCSKKNTELTYAYIKNKNKKKSGKRKGIRHLIRISCENHKTNEMYDLTKSVCLFENCGKIATNGYTTNGQKRERCEEHSINNMVNLDNLPHNWVCIICLKDWRTYCPINEKKQKWCKSCAIKQNIKFHDPSRKLCICNNAIPCFAEFKNGVQISERIYCKKCRPPNSKNVKGLRCPSCKMFIVETKGKLCSVCSDTNKKKTKENEMVKYIINYIKTNKIDVNEINDEKIIHDKIIVGGCSKYRPDLLVEVVVYHERNGETFPELMYYVFECDEDQHNSYDPECEMKRMFQIQQDLGCEYVKFIRYNPDICWYIDTVNGNGRKKKDETTTEERLSAVMKEFEYNLKLKNHSHLSVSYLFYNYEINEDSNPNQPYLVDYDLI